MLMSVNHRLELEICARLIEGLWKFAIELLPIPVENLLPARRLYHPRAQWLVQSPLVSGSAPHGRWSPR
jgi:hypothetical protein